MSIKFNASKADFYNVTTIVNRALGRLPGADRMQLTMDLVACHLNGCPLKLEELAVAKDFDFFHDVAGIRYNINRETGQLDNCFMPRYAE